MPVLVWSQRLTYDQLHFKYQRTSSNPLKTIPWTLISSLKSFLNTFCKVEGHNIQLKEATAVSVTVTMKDYGTWSATMWYESTWLNKNDYLMSPRGMLPTNVHPAMIQKKLWCINQTNLDRSWSSSAIPLAVGLWGGQQKSAGATCDYAAPYEIKLRPFYDGQHQHCRTVVLQQRFCWISPHKSAFVPHMHHWVVPISAYQNNKWNDHIYHLFKPSNMTHDSVPESTARVWEICHE